MKREIVWQTIGLVVFSVAGGVLLGLTIGREICGW